MKTSQEHSVLILPPMIIASIRVQNEVVNNLRKIRMGEGMSVKQLADALGTSRGQVYQLENEARQLSPHWIKRIQSVLACTADELLGLATPTGFSDQSTPFTHEQVAMPPEITMEGDNMSPTLRDGDVIVLDTTKRQITDGIYALRYRGAPNNNRAALKCALGQG